MIRRYVDAIGTLGVGLAVGWLLSAMVSNESASQSGPAPAVSPESTPLAVDSVGEVSTAIDTGDCLDTPVRSARMVYAGPEPLPEVYRNMIGIAADRTSTPEPYDRYAAFVRDVRDEPWAAAMEAGITIWAAEVKQRDRIVIDYVECRSRFCMIAGYSPTGNTAQLGLLRDAGWWQAEGVFSSKLYSGPGRQSDFVLFVERYADGN